MNQSPDLSGIDVERYDFDELRADIAAILDVQSAVVSTLKWSLVLPAVGIFVAWNVFDARTSRWALIPFILALAAAMLFAAINIGILFTLRNRLDRTNEAADRVITTTSAIHVDYLRIRRGESDLPMAAIAKMLTRELVFPALTASSTAAFATATTASGPMGWLVARMAAGPMKMVERRVLEALEAPDPPDHDPLKDIEALQASDDIQDDRAHDDVAPVDGYDDASARTAGTDLVAAALGPEIGDEFGVDLGDFYTKAHGYLNRVVDGVGFVATGSLGTVVAISLLPVIGLLAFGWFVL